MDLPSSFDTANLHYPPMHLALPHFDNGADPFQDMLLPMDLQPQSYVGDEDYNYTEADDTTIQAAEPRTSPTSGRSHDEYEDAFPEVTSVFENPLASDAHSVDGDNELLSFSQPHYDYTPCRNSIALSAQLHGMFFLAESPWVPTSGEADPNITELTCYRRNLFQITGKISIPRFFRHVTTDQGKQIPIVALELAVTATESLEGNTAKIIIVPWKTPPNLNRTQTEDKAEREPAPVRLDIMNIQDMDGEFIDFPFQFKRLQFRIATANNGRRKELQQHFVVQLQLVATLSTNDRVPLCSVSSGAIIVRGRSPRNFQSRKGMPLNVGNTVRKISQLQNGTQGDRPMQQSDVPLSTPSKYSETKPSSEAAMSYFDMASTQEETKSFRRPRGTSLLQPVDQGTYFGSFSNVPVALSSSDQSKSPKNANQPSAPIKLMLVEDDRPRSENAGRPPSGRSAKKLHIPAKTHSLSTQVLNSPDESADLLYEYFPLSLDDWMPPVDAVYRPHVVHHTKHLSDFNSAKSARSKRYFSEDMG